MKTFQWIPDRAAALARVDDIDPRAYARTRNALDGAVTRLSPWITHGFVDLPEIVSHLREHRDLGPLDKLTYEFAWREFFHHVRRHAGEGILDDLRTPVWSGRYAQALPDDVRTGSTGVRVIDAGVRQLYADGWLHNHHRMWIASYVVHTRKVHWRVGADWMYGHLLDGDLPSNHLSWQWCAGTFSAKPYLFDAANVARHAPALASPGTAIDHGYAALETHARSGGDAGPEPTDTTPTAMPALLQTPPASSAWPAIEATAVRGRRIALLHPWSMRRPADADVAIGVFHAPFHARFPWSMARWDFVIGGMARVADVLWWGDISTLRAALKDATSVETVHTDEPEYMTAIQDVASVQHPAPRFTADPAAPCRSFSDFWGKVAPAWQHRGASPSRR